MVASHRSSERRSGIRADAPRNMLQSPIDYRRNYAGLWPEVTACSLLNRALGARWWLVGIAHC